MACNVDQSIASNTVKEVKEETGYSVSPEKLIAVQDWRKHNVTNYASGVVKFFIMCKFEGGEFKEKIETTEVRFFDRDSLPEKLAVEKMYKRSDLDVLESL